MVTRHLTAGLSGLLFGLGLALSGMTNPEKVLAFLDITGDWNADLLWVLGGATTVTLLAFHSILRQPVPLLDSQFHLPKQHRLDGSLLFGAMLFGIGWGIAGYCPGPAVALLAVPDNRELWLFLPGLLVGQWVYRCIHPRNRSDS